MNVLCSNINGLRNNFTELKYVVRNKKPNIIFLNETHCTSDCDTGDLNIVGYDFVNCVSHSKHTGGVCVFIKKNLKYFNIKIDCQQIAWYLSFELIVNESPTILACVYLSSNNEHKIQTLNSFEHWYELISVNKSVIICGDFNINMLAETTHSRRLRNFSEENGLNLLVNSPTRITENTSTLIDLCFSNINKNKISCSVSNEDQISDHSILFIKILGHNDKVISKTRKICIWKNYDEHVLWQYIESSMHLWNNIEFSDINNKMNWLIHTISSATNKFKELKEISTNEDFFDRELETMRRRKNQLYKIAQFSTTTEEKSLNWHEYRVFKNNYKKTIQIKKFEFNQRKLNRVQGNNKAMWKVLNSILYKENTEITRIKINDNIFDDDVEITNKFNCYFVESIVELNDNIPVIPFVDDIPVNENLRFEFRNVSITEIKTCLRELKNSTDEFFINPRVLLDAIFVIGQHLVNIINQSFDTGIFPDILKKSTIVPIQKKTGSIQLIDHRPIHTLPCCERLLESLAYNQLIHFVETNNILTNNQSGFRALHSCETAINDVLFDWKAAQNDSKIIIAVFLDFQRAFETIDPSLLIHKLAKYGVHGTSLNWFKSYLTGRKQIVKLGETLSNELNNQLGVPQGSILGPLLFILYINDIPLCLKYCQAKLFADDTLIYVIADSINDALIKINYDLEILYNKLCQSKLKLNINKTKAMIISNKNIDKSNINIIINGSKLEIQNEIKYLGNIIDDKLNLEKNISHVCRKVGQKVNVLNRLRNELNSYQKLTLYKSIIEPHFTYCASILFISNSTDLNRLQIIQNKCLRQILRVDNYTQSSAMLAELNLMSVVQLIYFRTLIFIYKIVKDHAPYYLTKRIEYKFTNHHRQLRNANEICLPNLTKTCSQNSLFYKGMKLFNTLPNEITNQIPISKFKNALSEFIYQNF